jgi:hypothetical protein
MDQTIQKTQREKKKLSCDQVSWIMASLDRFQSASCNFPMVSSIPRAAQLATLLEIMEILGYEFQDSSTARNALSQFHLFEMLRGDE